MNIEIRRVYHANDDIFSLELKIEYSTEEEQNEMHNLLGNRFDNLADTLREEFKEHKNLYKEIDERFLAKEYSPDNYYFHESDRGFRQFIRELTERELNQLAEIYSTIILGRAEYIRDMYRRENTARLEVGLGTLDQNVELEKLNIKNPAVLVTEDGAYAFELKPMKNVDSLQGIKENIYNTLHRDMNSQLQTLKQSYERRIQRLKEKFNRQKNELFAEILKNSKDIFAQWEFVEFEGDLYLKYKERIIMNKVFYRGVEYDYPGEEGGLREFYVSGLKVRVAPFIRESDVKITRGVNIHFKGSEGCIGALNGRPLFQVLKELPDALRIGNMDSPLNIDLSNYLEDKFIPNASRSDNQW